MCLKNRLFLKDRKCMFGIEENLKTQVRNIEIDLDRNNNDFNTTE
jgi:hypothetical protein